MGRRDLHLVLVFFLEGDVEVLKRGSLLRLVGFLNRPAQKLGCQSRFSF